MISLFPRCTPGGSTTNGIKFGIVVGIHKFALGGVGKQSQHEYCSWYNRSDSSLPIHSVSRLHRSSPYFSEISLSMGTRRGVTSESSVTNKDLMTSLTD